MEGIWNMEFLTKARSILDRDSITLLDTSGSWADMTEQPITLQVLSESLLQDLLQNIIRQQTLQSVSRHRSIQENSGTSASESIKYETSPIKDIYGQDKMKLKTSESSRYFQCENCGRKIAGGRFAQHVNKCLERRRT